jgi:hypothetical protein
MNTDELKEKLYEILNKHAAETELWNNRIFHMIEAGNFYEVVEDLVKLLATPDVSKRKTNPPKPPKDREVHLSGFSRHKRD